MRTTFCLLKQATPQYKWHKHVPLIKFLGPRKLLWNSKPAETQNVQTKSAGQEAINFWELPARYRPLPISEAEIEAIESGGASI
ncbi:hypothetical protein BX667DRAFT_495545, partial [Coemansia mojavensis]